MKKLTSWVAIPKDTDFSIYNLPFGIFSHNTDAPKAGIAIGNYVIDVAGLAANNLIDPDAEFFQKPFLNDFIALGKAVTNKVRLDVQKLLVDTNSKLRSLPELLIPMAEVQLRLPITIGDYTDFYSSKEHATNVGKMFRDPKNALLPNWKHIPVGYHGRASSIVVSEVPIRRPKGQTWSEDAKRPIFQATKKLDFELEMAFILGKESELGTPISTESAEDYIFGMVLFNDWSARDIQKWEYVPLGPFLGKNFASSMSPWIVTTEALAPFRVKGPVQDPKVLPYLEYSGDQNYDIRLEAAIQPNGKAETAVSTTNFKDMYWNMAQQLAHHTVNGCNVKVGDVMASGTISGQTKSSYGSMLELAWSGTKPLTLNDGTTRTFIKDQDTVVLRGAAEKEGIKVGFGEVRTLVLPSKK